ncbi:DUF6801 domain-containing protein [Nocardioides sp.]|uniref:DUF6801 domain-containing protein n=1 Tax=Nocardioides sp. TaxID=35761 RepID=UPI0039E245BE
MPHSIHPHDSRRSGRVLVPAVLVLLAAAMLFLLPTGPARAADTDTDTVEVSGTVELSCTSFINAAAWTASIDVQTELPASLTPGETVAARPVTYAINVGNVFSVAAARGTAWTMNSVRLGLSDPYLELLVDGVSADAVKGETFLSEWIDLTERRDDLDDELIATTETTLPAFVVPENAETSIELALGAPVKLYYDWVSMDLPDRDAEEAEFQGCTATSATFGTATVTPQTTSATEVATKTLTKTVSYSCYLSGSSVTTAVSITAAATVPERVAPGSKVRVPVQFSIGLPALLIDVASAYGEFETYWGYSDNLELNATVAATTTAYRFPRVSATGTLPASGAFTAEASSTAVRVEVPSEVTSGTVDLSLPTAEQIEHPRTDIGGRISFTMNAQLYSPAYATPLYAILVCTAPAGADLSLGSMTIDPDVEVVTDEEVVIDNEEVEVLTQDTPSGDLWVEVSTASLNSGASRFTARVSNAAKQVMLTSAVKGSSGKIASVTSTAAGTAKVKVDLAKLKLADGKHTLVVTEPLTQRTGKVRFTVADGRLAGGSTSSSLTTTISSSLPAGDLAGDLGGDAFAEAAAAPEVATVPVETSGTVPVVVPAAADLAVVAAPLAGAGEEGGEPPLAPWLWGIAAVVAVGVRVIVGQHVTAVRRLREQADG